MIINHPTIPGLSKNVPDDAAQSWLDQGWLIAGTDEALAAAPKVEVSRFVNEPKKAAAVQTDPKTLAPPAKSEPCPTCGATGDDPCVTPSGNATKRHAKRA